MKISNLINSISLKISILLFDQRVPLSYIFFNKLYKILIIKKDIINEEIYNFHYNGFEKLKININEGLIKFKNNLSILENDNGNNNYKINKRQYFKIDQNKKVEFKSFLEKSFASTINRLSSYYKSEVNIESIKFFRINHEDNSEMNNKEVYSNYFHQDAYLFTYIKIFVNLMDISETDGPLEIISINDRSKFIKKFKYKDRNNYKYIKDDIIYKNTGKAGDCFLFSSPQCFHKAGIPSKYRDILQVILVASPKLSHKNSKSLQEKDLFENDKIISLTKPYSVYSTIKLFIEHLFYSIKYKYY